jgi:hypothetical protein
MTYKPGWKITISRPIDRGIHNYWEPITLHAKYPTIDVNTGETIMLQLLRSIDVDSAERYPEEQLVDLIGFFIKSFEMHEFDEWFKIDGVCVRDPHPEQRDISTSGVKA